MISFAELDNKKNGDYLKLLSVLAKLSNLFSESSIPYIHYRIVENIFCRSFSAGNLSRNDTAFDAQFNNTGVGIKTFTCPGHYSTEKIAEFNSLSKNLQLYKEKALAVKLAEYRNERINLALRTYNLSESVYHIVARREKELVLFETDYNLIDIDKIKNVKMSSAGIQFNDGIRFYSYNFSKSTLFRKFEIPESAYKVPVEIIDDPYSLLLRLFQKGGEGKITKKFVPGSDYVILPLYGYKKREKFVFPKSGLNQWNAGGRERNIGEVYIPIPIAIHDRFPRFFPSRDTEFTLSVPTGEVLNAKVCQDNSKALMTNPNKALSDWLLRKVFGLKEGELATIDRLNILGFDSVIIKKHPNNHFSIDKAKLDSYENFMAESNFDHL